MGKPPASHDAKSAIYRSETLDSDPLARRRDIARFTTTRLPDIPPLAWLFDASPARPRLVCGDSVEAHHTHHHNWFFEGAWAGDFTHADFDKTANVFGTGGIAHADDPITFVTSSHTLDALYLLLDPDRRLVSNSLAFLLRYARVDPATLPHLPRRIATLLPGLERADTLLHQQHNLRIERHAYCQLRLIGDRVQRVPKPLDPPLPDFATYHHYLRDTLAATRDNALHPARRTRYPLLTTCSSGYDSAACAALAADLGATHALTIRTARYNLIDSGKGVAQQLGLSCTEVDRPERTSPDNAYADAEALASFCPGDASFHVFDRLIHQRLLLTGHHGDKSWSTDDPDPEHFHRHGGGSGMGFHELRLRNDCILIPVPYIGCYDQQALTRISRSDEMEPWRLDTDYDRPIARRLAEEAGVDRHLFGQRKAVGSIAFYEWRFDPATVHAADAFTRRLTGPGFWFNEKLQRLASRLLTAGMNTPPRTPGSPPRPRHAVRALCRRLMGRYKNRLLWRPYRTYMTLWALEEVGRRYPTAADLGATLAQPVPGE